MRVDIDPTLCQAHGACATACPEVFKLDEWGYAFVAEGMEQVPEELKTSARLAVETCPENAIRAS